MYTPRGANSIPVTLATLKWYWFGEAIYTQGQWQRVIGGASTNPSGSDSTTLPEWSNYGTNLKFTKD